MASVLTPGSLAASPGPSFLPLPCPAPPPCLWEPQKSGNTPTSGLSLCCGTLGRWCWRQQELVGEEAARGSGRAPLRLSKPPASALLSEAGWSLLVSLTLMMKNGGAFSNFVASKEALHLNRQFRVDGAKLIFSKVGSHVKKPSKPRLHCWASWTNQHVRGLCL